MRVVIKEGELWFLASDVCSVLEHSDTSMAIKRLDLDEKLTQTMFVSGQNRDVWLINESINAICRSEDFIGNHL
nr:Bro-N domain-containing protein [Brevibacillus laterosporus]